jgi:purine-nucleoside phosphorylase
MESFRKQVEEATSFIRSLLLTRPRIGLILGTGLGGVADAMREKIVIPYEEIPHFPVSTVVSHQGQLICGTWSEKPAMVMQGRFHLYEGYTPRQISFPIRVMAALGIRTLIITNAVGGLNPLFRPGDLMMITDHINMTGHSPLMGPNIDAWGPRFPDMAEPYSRKLQDLALEAALSERIPLHRGVYVGVVGPNLETAAETRFFRAIGCDAVGMSVIMEAITAVHAGMDVLGISVVTNVNLPDNYQPAMVEDIIATAENAGPRLMRLLETVLRTTDQGESASGLDHRFGHPRS